METALDIFPHSLRLDACKGLRGVNRRVLLEHRQQIEAHLAMGFNLREIFNVIVATGVELRSFDAFAIAASRLGVPTAKARNLAGKSLPAVEATEDRHAAYRMRLAAEKARSASAELTPKPIISWNPNPRKEDLV